MKSSTAVSNTAATVTNNVAEPTRKAFNSETFHQQLVLLYRASSVWLRDHWTQILIAVAVAAAIVIILHAVRHWGMRLCRKRSGSTGWATIIGRAVAKTGNFFIITLAAKLVVGFASAPLIVNSVITFLFTIAAVFQGAVWAREIILGVIERRTQSDDYHGEAIGSAMSLIRLFVTLALFSIAFIVILDNIGVNVTGLVAGLGVGGIAIGLAAQGIFADLFAALSIIFDRPFRKGDSIAYDSTFGSIEQIGLKSTRVRAFTGEELIISNRKLLDKEITNNTRRNHRRGSFVIGLIYQTPAQICATIPDMLKQLVEANDAIFVRSGFTGFGGSSLDFELLFDTDGPDYASFYATRTAIGVAIMRKFDEEGIEIAYPTQTNFTADPQSGKAILPFSRDRSGQQVTDAPARD